MRLISTSRSFASSWRCWSMLYDDVTTSLTAASLSSSSSVLYKYNTTTVLPCISSSTIHVFGKKRTFGTHRSYSSTLPLHAPSSSSSSSSGTELHAFFQEQMAELERERKALFGDNNNNNNNADADAKDAEDLIANANKLSQMQQQQFQEQYLQYHHQQQQQLPTNDEESIPDPFMADSGSNSNNDNVDMEELHSERDAIFQFSKTERVAWGNAATQSTNLSAQYMKDIQDARDAHWNPQQEQQPQQQQQQQSLQTSLDSHPDNNNNYDHSHHLHHHDSFSHLSTDGNSVHMVNVGHKQVTTRTAHAQSKVILPDSVLQAFQSTSQEELVGPKGPIFTTAKLAGIMAAKKTSDLIPLCHPLPLDQVQIDIVLPRGSNEVVIDCTCRVTHKTGVEMEALTGATIAALTIYDMVKAVSHQVQITDTKLISKTGGKRTVLDDDDGDDAVETTNSNANT